MRNRKPTDRLEAELAVAHVLFMDVVSYSLLPMDAQNDTVRELQQVVSGVPEFKQALGRKQLVCMPTGDGMALAFFGDPSSPLRCARDIAIALKDDRLINLRMGIHTGPVYRVADINANRNVAGGGINVAQRVMDCGDAGHILISSAAAAMLLELSSGWKTALHDLGEITVKHGALVHIFNVYTEEFGNSKPPARVSAGSALKRSATSTPRQGLTLNLGRLVTKMCNRRSQEDEFKSLFLENARNSRSSAQMYILPGEEGECHESLVERLGYQVQMLAGEAASEERPPLKFKKIPWQYEGDVESRKRHLFAWLIEQLGSPQQLQMADVSPAALARLLAVQLASFVILQHDIRAARWDQATDHLIQSYRKFLADLPSSPGAPKLIVFLNVIYPSSPGWLQSPMGFLCTVGRRRVQSHLRKLAVDPEDSRLCPCTVLSELASVTRDDVLEWFSLHDIGDSEEDRLEKAARIFPRGQYGLRRHMAEVEVFLREAHHAFITESGCQ